MINKHINAQDRENESKYLNESKRKKKEREHLWVKLVHLIQYAYQRQHFFFLRSNDAELVYCM